MHLGRDQTRVCVPHHLVRSRLIDAWLPKWRTHVALRALLVAVPDSDGEDGPTRGREHELGSKEASTRTVLYCTGL
eukprot:10239570-Heterocapsa_arctica.AAC.1